MGSQKCCLRWNDFEKNISVAFRELREDKDFFDVTLACGDEQLQAHKVILSACSPFFRTILKRNPHTHPLLYLRGVKYTDLQAVLDFMYHGEVNLAQEELNSFLAVAEELKIRGLTQDEAQNSKPSPPPPRRPPSKPVSRPPPSETVPPTKGVRPADYDIQEKESWVKVEPQETWHTLAADVEEQYEEQGRRDYGLEGGYEGGLEALGGNKHDADETCLQVTSEEGTKVWRCLYCCKNFGTKSSCRRHVETLHYETPSLGCEVCGKTLKNKNSHQNHMNMFHGQKKSLKLD